LGQNRGRLEKGECRRGWFSGGDGSPTTTDPDPTKWNPQKKSKRSTCGSCHYWVLLEKKILGEVVFLDHEIESRVTKGKGKNHPGHLTPDVKSRGILIPACMQLIS